MNDLAKMKAVLFYVLEKTEKKKGFGKVKLWKTLWEADVKSLGQTGKSVTGLTHYTKLPLGPVPLSMQELLEDLIKNGEVREAEVPYYGVSTHKYFVYKPERNFDALSREEKEGLDAAIAEISKKTAAKVSEASHDHVWHSHEMNEELPIVASNLIPEDVTDEDLELLKPYISQEAKPVFVGASDWIRP